MAIREQRMSGFIMVGQLREELGFEGYSEAMRRRWILPDQEASGMVTLTNHLGTVAEMRALAEEHKNEKCPKCHATMKEFKCDGEKCDGCGHVECTCDGKKLTSECAIIAQSHAFRNKPGLVEIATMGVGQTSDHSTPVVGVGNAVPNPSATQLPAQQAPARTGSAPVGVGTDVRVVQDGKAYACKVAKVGQDGKYEVSFAAEKPAVQRTYDHTELQPVTDAR